MGVLLKSIRKILVELIDRIDSGECATTDEQERMFLDLCTMIADKERRVSKYEACRYLNMSRAKFDRYVSEGRIPHGRKSPGFKELSWSLAELDSCKLNKCLSFIFVIIVCNRSVVITERFFFEHYPPHLSIVRRHLI